MESYLAYRCPHCGSDRCGNDANAGWDVVLQQSVLLGEFDNQWCNDCGDVTLEELTITDPIEIARIDAVRADLRIQQAASRLLSAGEAVLAVRHGPDAARSAAFDQLHSAISAARCGRGAGSGGRASSLA